MKRSDVIATCKCGGIMCIAVVERVADGQEHTFVCEQCTSQSSFVFSSPSIVPSK